MITIHIPIQNRPGMQTSALSNLQAMSMESQYKAQVSPPIPCSAQISVRCIYMPAIDRSLVSYLHALAVLCSRITRITADEVSLLVCSLKAEALHIGYFIGRFHRHIAAVTGAQRYRRPNLRGHAQRSVRPSRLSEVPTYRPEVPDIYSTVLWCLI